MDNLYGEIIREAREKKGWTQQQLGAAVGMTGTSGRTMISRYEKNQAVPRIKTREKIASVLDIPRDRMGLVPGARDAGGDGVTSEHGMMVARALGWLCRYLRDAGYAVHEDTSSVTPTTMVPAFIQASKDGKHDKALAEIVGNLDSTGFPERLTLEEQGMFWMGYHTMRV